MAPVRGTFDCWCLEAKAPEAICKALCPEASSSKLVFEIGRQHGAGPPLMAMSFQEAKIQLKAGDVTYKSILWFDSYLMTRSSKSFIGLRSIYAAFDPPTFDGTRDTSYSIKGIMDVNLEPVEPVDPLGPTIPAGGFVDLQWVQERVCDSWIGDSTGKYQYRHVYDLDNLERPAENIKGIVHLNLVSILDETDLKKLGVESDWLTLQVRGVRLKANWKLEGPTKRPAK